MEETGKVLFLLTDDALIAANSGAAFTREGVIAVCHACISPKSNNPPEDIYSENGMPCADERLPALIRDRFMGLDANMRRSFIGQEAQTAEDYAGRFELELLQNADDAVGERDNSELIGAKGKGFKSVLEITDKPEITSGDFHFALETLIDGLRVPALSPALGSKLFPDASTVIRLGLRNQAAKDAAIRALKDIRPEMLLFCQRLSHVEIHIDGESPRVFELDRDGIFGFNNGKAVFTLKENSIPQKWIRWSAAWTSENNQTGKRLSAALCLPIDENGEVAPLERENPLHVFFPTNEAIPGLMALPHASYLTEGSRKHLLEAEKQADGPAIRDKIGGMVDAIIGDIPPSVSLRVFGKVSPPDDGARDKNIGLLQRDASKVVANTPFVPVIGGGKVAPANARLWGYGLGYVLRKDSEKVHAARLLTPSLNYDAEVRGILENKLKAKRIGGLPEHARILSHCENDDNEKCVAAFRVANSILRARGSESDEVPNILKRAPFWRTDNSNSPVRALTGDTPLLWHRPDDWPEWLPADALSPEFTDGIRDDDFKAMKNAMGKDWPLDECRRYFWDVLIPFCREKSTETEWWEKMGANVIQWVLKWGEENFGVDKGLLVSTVGEQGGGEIGEVIHLPTNKGWLPAIHCYFGPAWGGREYYGKAEGTGVVRPPNEWGAQDSPEWRRMLAWLGVWWTPKSWRVENEHRIHKPALEALIRFAKPEELLADVCEMARIFGERGENSTTFRQMQQENLIPCRPGIFHPDARRVKPREAYMPGCGIKGYFPEVVKIPGGLDEKMKEWLPRLGVLMELPSNENKEQWAGYMRRVAEEARRRDGNSDDLRWEKGKLARVIRHLYEKFNAPLDGMGGDVPYLRQESNGVFVDFAPWENVRWMDIECDKDYPTVYREILAESNNIFPFHFGKGRSFGLTPVSGNLEWLHRLAGKCESDRLRWAMKEGEKDGDVARFIRKWYSELHRNASEGGADNVPYLRQESNRKVFVDFAPKDDVYWMDMECHKNPAVYSDILEAFKIFPPQLGEGSHFGLTPLSASNMEWLHKVVKNVGKNSPNRLRWDKGKVGDVAKFIDVLYRGDKYGAPPVGAAFAPFLRQKKKGSRFIDFAAADEVRWADKPEYEDPKVRRALQGDDRFKIFPWPLNSGEAFKIARLSTSGEIQEDFSSGQNIPGKVEKLWRWYSERERAFVLLDGDNGKRLLLENLRVCSFLRLILRDCDGQTIVESPILFCIKEDALIINDSRPPLRAFASGLAQWMGKSQYNADFECILGDEDWVGRLRDWGISEEDLEPLEHEIENQSEQSSAEADPDSSLDQDPENLSDDTPVEKESGPGRNGGSNRRGGRGGRSRRSRRSGSGGGGGGGGGESDEHKLLKQRIAEDPAIIGLPESAQATGEHWFPTMTDRVDILFKTDAEYVAVEVKTIDCLPDEIRRGAYQCVKYDALLKAAIELRDLPPKKGRTILALGGEFPAGMERIREFLEGKGIKIWDSLSAPAPS